MLKPLRLSNRLITKPSAVLALSVMASYSLAVISKPTKQDYFALSLEQLANIKVITSSKREQSVDESYANVTVVTDKMIARRGYRNIIEILEDLPGFDFATYDDGGGEYPVHNLNRGIGGDNGNTRMMVMVDGLVQNHISFNWAQSLTDEQMLFDIERIEVVQGPGSALYGAQAVSGIIHIITKKKFKGTSAKLLIGQNNTQSAEALLGGSTADVYYQLALKRYVSDGDGGHGRPDPGGYFSNNVYPNILTAHYDENGSYVEDVPHPMAGQSIANGFNNAKDDTNLRLKVSADNLEIGVQYWNKKDGLGSYVVGYEYDATADDFITHHSALSIYMKNQKSLIDNKLNWQSNLWYRQDSQESDTGFRYLYRFNQLKKSYHSSSSQIGLENQFDLKLGEENNLVFGFRFLGNRQTEQVVSLGQIQSGNASTTTSSWDLAVNGQGLNQEKVNEIFDENEMAIYALYEGQFSQKLSYSIGNRYSNGSDYGDTNTPRLGLIYKTENDWLVKALYGKAYRQPSLFELRDEFRGNIELVPESIDTYEIEFNKAVTKEAKIKLNAFYSSLEDSIELIEDSSPGGESYANVDSFNVRGLSTQLDYQPQDNLSFYANYMFQQGQNKDSNSSRWGKLNHTAQHKINLGVNWQPLGNDFNLNLRANYVGQRKVPMSNRYFSEGRAPDYTKLDLVTTWTNLWSQSGLTAQLIINNLLDEDYFGVGRQSGSSLVSDYDPTLNPDPTGFIPAYHPQAGRMIYLSVSYR
jgi:outer membrane receptor for ferrienterochelin and colicins